MELYHCFGHWLCKKLELRVVGLPLSKFGTDQLCWAETSLWNFCCRLHLLLGQWACLSVVLIYFSLLLLLSATRKLCWLNLSLQILITRYKSGTILSWNDICQIFSKKCHFQIISDVQWWTKKFHPFLDSTYQEWMVFAKIGDDSCYYLWNEICAGVFQYYLFTKSHYKFWNFSTRLLFFRAD